MKMQNTAVEFVAFDAVDVIATSGLSRLSYVTPNAFEGYGYKGTNGFYLYDSAYSIYLYTWEDPYGDWFTISEDADYQLDPSLGGYDEAFSMCSVIVNPTATPQGKQITTWAELLAWIKAFTTFPDVQ